MEFPGLTARAITEIGNIAVVGPAAITACVVLWLARARALSTALALEVSTVFVATVLLKRVSRHFGGAFHGSVFLLSGAAPSGHMAMSTAAYGGIAVICALQGRGSVRMLVPAAALATIVTVGVTRVLVHAHTPADVVSAVLVCALPLIALARRANRLPGGTVPPLWPVAIAAAVTAGCFYAAGLRYNSTGI